VEEADRPVKGGTGLVEKKISDATNQDVGRLVTEGKFREDLYYRLSVGTIVLPPLRERKEDIVPLSYYFLWSKYEQGKTRFKKISREAEQKLSNYPWPGNIRELKNAIERVVLLHEGTVVQPKHFAFLSARPGANSPMQGDPGPALRAAIPEGGIDLNEHILSLVAAAMKKYNGNKTRAAGALGISIRTLHT
jgi:two-component system, NtrC family, response regulator AtoC